MGIMSRMPLMPRRGFDGSDESHAMGPKPWGSKGCDIKKKKEKKAYFPRAREGPAKTDRRAHPVARTANYRRQNDVYGVGVTLMRVCGPHRWRYNPLSQFENVRAVPADILIDDATRYSQTSSRHKHG